MSLILLGLDGLFHPSTGVRVSEIDGMVAVTEDEINEINEANEAIGGYRITQVRSREEAIEWARQWPMSNKEGPTKGPTKCPTRRSSKSASSFSGPSP